MNEFVIDFPTLGDLNDAWITAHCRQPDGPLRGRPFQLSDWQFWILANRLRIRDDAEYVPPEEVTIDNPMVLNQAFTYRQTLTVGPQKTGKGPTEAAFVADEAKGPVIFDGWAQPGDCYRCSDWGCPCGFEFPYQAGEPKGRPHPSPLIQMTANSEDQVKNAYRPLQAMIQLGPLKHLLLVRDNFIRILQPGIDGEDDGLDLDRIDIVTSSAKSRLGNPISDAEQDEAGLYTDSNGMIKVADTQRRGAAGMGGRTHAWTNAWDPSENSYAQRIWEAQAEDVFIFYRNPDLDPRLRHEDGSQFSFFNKRERRQILSTVYEGSPWVSIDSIDAEAVALMRTDPNQAERFFGNRLVQGAGAWLDEGVWAKAYAGTPDMA
ncbi:terminase [Bifidobacterium vansinderenii]|uniref:Terminase n=1 Tax=Bifidobacterium vansinderenii TaxID=1984871 RepID=A0A229W1B1_9BIFI|nr:terminase [Bifidobacterium vansinderenii]OXN01470.1 terminase [Bifidobacterium vansinderenii]